MAPRTRAGRARRAALDLSAPGRAALLAAAGVLPLLVWWLGWFPGFLSSDSIDQLGQAARFELNNAHPAVHTLAIWAVTRVWDSPGAVTLLQVLVMAGLLATIAYRLTRLGVPWWLSGGSAVVVAALPSVSTSTIALWKDVPYTFALLWAFAELLGWAEDGGSWWARRWPPLRLGVALGLVWLFRHNGFLTVLPFLAVVAMVLRGSLRSLLPTLGALAAVVLVVQYGIYPVAGVDRTAIEPGAVFISDVAASLRHEPGNFTSEELLFLEGIAPLEIWRFRYDCHDSTALVFADEFNGALLVANAGEFRELVVKTYLRDPDTVAGHRLCAANYLFWPAQPGDAYFQRPPYDIAANDLGLARDPISDRAFRLTRSIFVWAEPDGRLWLTWRPALAVWLGAVAFAGVAWRRRLRPLLVVAALIVAQILNVAATTPAQEFRFAFGVYVMALLSVPLAWLVVRPDDAAVAATLRP